MYVIFFLVFACFGFQPLFAEEKPITCTFFNLETISSGTSIEIRGFLYEAADTHLILADEPNLKSCCVGSSAKRAKQLHVDGDVHSAVNSSIPVTLQGNLLVDLNDPFPLKIQNAKIVAEKQQSYGMLLLIGTMMVLASIILVRTNKKNHR